MTAYCVTTFTVTAGVLIGGPDGGFLAGHMAATICWIGMAAGLFVRALRIADREARTGLIAGGLALTAAAMAKLFLFDLGTLDGMFRVAVFIVVGLVLLEHGRRLCPKPGSARRWQTIHRTGSAVVTNRQPAAQYLVLPSAAVGKMRAVHDAIDAEDPSTADILHQLIDGLEKLSWLIKSENRRV